jgi:O-antigen/teichoic acid export membrane protein
LASLSELEGTPVSLEDNPAAAPAKVTLGKILGIDAGTVRNKLIPWASKGSLAIIDQGLISGSNFLVNILLARWLGAEQYGAYAIAFGVFVLLSLVYQSLVLEPMAVYGGSTYRDCMRSYLNTLLKIHFVISLSLLVVFGATAFVIHVFGQGSGLGGAFAGVTVASPFVLVFWLARRTFYLELSPAEAAAGSLLYSGLVMVGLFVAYQRGWLSTLTAFLLIALGAALSSAALWWRLRSQLKPGRPGPGLGETWKRHWSYGRWALATCVAGWIPAYIYYPILSSFTGMAQSGQLKALMNLTLPFEQTKAALSMLFLPYAARVAARKNRSGAAAMTGQMTLLAFGGAIVYWGIVLPFRVQIFHLMYSGKYMEVMNLLPLVAFGQIFWSAAYGPAIALRGMEAPDAVFKAFAVATVASLVVGIPATWYWGLKGAIWGSNLADVTSLIMVFAMVRRRLNSVDASSMVAANEISVAEQPSTFD